MGMLSVRDAVIVTEEYRDINGKKKIVKEKLFEESEIYRAEGIVEKLKGLTINSARELLEKINQYLMMNTID